jgi:hypothetical protein
MKILLYWYLFSQIALYVTILGAIALFNRPARNDEEQMRGYKFIAFFILSAIIPGILICQKW